MLMDRIIGAFTFRKEVYSEVERDENFTSTAWILVAVIAFLNQLGSRALLARQEGFGQWIIGAIIATVIAVIGFAVAMLVISWVGRALFQAEVDFNEMVRALGLAYVWNIIGVVGVLGAFSPTLVCLVSPAVLIGSILGLVAWLIAAKEALDLEWLQTIVTIVVGWIVVFVFAFLASVVLGILGFTARGIVGAVR